MRRSILAVLAAPFLLVLALAPLPAPAGAVPGPDQPAAEEAPPEAVASELARLNRTLSRIVELLERQTEGQRLDLALKRLEVESDRVSALEEELRRAESSKQSLEDEEFMLRTRFSSLAAEVEQAETETSVEQLRFLEQQAAQAERMLDRIASQVEEKERRILELQNELTRRRSDLQALQDRLDRQLEGM